MLTFDCPYCGKYTLTIAPRIVCPNCRGAMKSAELHDLENRTLLKSGKDLFTAKTADDFTVKFTSLNFGSIFSSTLYAVFPAQGMATRSPLTIVFDREDFPQDHPQLDRPFTRFFIKGLLYSVFWNIIPFAIFNPPVIIFWLSTVAFAGAYYYFSRKIIAQGATAIKLIVAQQQSESKQNGTN